MNTGKSIRSLKNLFKKYGKYDYTEPISLESHMVQSAMWARGKKYNKHVQLGCLLHDVGHMVALQNELPQMMTKGVSYGGKNHDKVGSDYLRGLNIDEDVCKMVENHVNAKRYMVSKYKVYYNLLSTASKISLDDHQGGKMSEYEMYKFETDPLNPAYLALRMSEEQSKIPNMKIGSVNGWIDTLILFNKSD